VAVIAPLIDKADDYSNVNLAVVEVDANSIFSSSLLSVFLKIGKKTVGLDEPLFTQARMVKLLPNSHDCLPGILILCPSALNAALSSPSIDIL